MKSRIIMVAAMLGLLATACNKEEVTTQDDMTVKTPVTISATYGGNGSKVNYTESGNTISATWQSGDKLLVIYNNHVNTLDLTTGAGSTSATFTGTISGTPAEGATLVCYVKDQNSPNGTVTVNDDGSYIYTSDAFLGQDGTLASAAKLNLYGGWTRYSSTSDINCSFSVNTSMMKFTVSGIDDDAGQTATLTYKSSGLEIAKATFIVAPGGSTLYLTIPAGQYTGTQHLVYNCNETQLSYQLSNTQANFTAGQTYSKDITYVNPNIDYSSDLSTPLTFEAKTARATVTLDGNAYLNMEFSLNGSAWSTYTKGTTITLYNVGEKVSFRGNNIGTFNSNSYSYNTFTGTGECYIYGNIMSLLSSSDYATTTTLTNHSNFRNLFWQNSSIYNHPTRKIMLPATTLTPNCYQAMFDGCTNLTAAPALPATVLASGCYCSMFAGCTSLTAAPALYATTLAHDCYHSMFEGCSALPSAPALPATTLDEFCYQRMFNGCTSLTVAPSSLPATTLARSCYDGMFQGCTSLTTAPSLPATTLASSCYSSMFYGCTSLSTAPSLPATTLASGCYYAMFQNCTSLTSAPALPATTLVENCYSYMFKNCTSLTSAPDLPARTLTSSCYFSMFNGCTNLNYVKCLATSIDSETYYWLQNVSPTGTFVKASSATGWGTGIHGIPSGWTVQNQ